MGKRELRIILGILTFSFLLGVVLGALLSSHSGAEADGEIVSFLSPLTEGADYNRELLFTLVSALALPLICFLFGLSLLGVLVIPAVFTSRALLLTFMVGACVRAFGTSTGLLTAAAASALPLLFSLPCLFVLGTQGMGTSLRFLASALRREAHPDSFGLSKRYFLRAFACLTLLLLSAGAELYVCPLLLKLVFAG